MKYGEADMATRCACCGKKYGDHLRSHCPDGSLEEFVPLKAELEAHSPTPDPTIGPEDRDYLVTATVQLVLPARSAGEARLLIMESLYDFISRSPLHDDPMNGCIVEGVEDLGGPDDY